MFGEVFVVTAAHTIDRAGFDLDHMLIPYSSVCATAIPFSDLRTYRSKEPNDVDHVDIVIAKCDKRQMDRSLFANEVPFDISFRELVSVFPNDMRLHFKGVSPELNVIDDEAQKYEIHYSAGDMFYQGPTGDRSIHLARAHVNQHCPDFDGMSGSPVFEIDNIHSKMPAANFAGMLIRGSRAHSKLRFLAAETISTYLFEFFVGEVPKAQIRSVTARLLQEEARRRGIPGPTDEEMKDLETPWSPHVPSLEKGS